DGVICVTYLRNIFPILWPMSSISCETPIRKSVVTLSSVKPHPGDTRIVVSLGRVHTNSGATYWDVPLNVNLFHVPRPPYNSTPAAKFSAQNVQRFPRGVFSGRLKPTAYPNSHWPPCTFFTPMKFSARFHCPMSLDRINFVSISRSCSWRVTL